MPLHSFVCFELLSEQFHRSTQDDNNTNVDSTYIFMGKQNHQ